MTDKKEINEIRQRIEKLEQTVKFANHIDAKKMAEIAVETIQWINKNATILDDIRNDILDNANPRELAEAISKGEIPPTHIGNPTVEVLEQELFSLLNIKKMFRDEAWENRFFTRLLLLEEKLPNEDFTSILKKLDNKMNGVGSSFYKFRDSQANTSTPQKEIDNIKDKWRQREK